MNINFNDLEILSPAGNPECFFSDINAGADAVYLGLSNFNARMKAENFTTENIREYVEYAHLFGVKVYVTVNTLLEDDDFENLIEMVKVLVNAKVDAFIVQDYGVAYILKNSFNNIVLHSSTQMGIHNLEGAKVAEKFGFTRIVLSREAKLEDIKLIHENTSLEIEYFIQGALCVAFSGNCYLSSIEKDMSGNKGKCLQLCRLPYTNNLTNETAYNLSARDLSLLENLPKLIEAGVTSFKIEGRLRHAGYCAISTNIYKTAIEKIKNAEFTNDWINKQYEILKQTFSRGDFNKNAYLDDGTPNNIIYKDYQNHIGTEIGTVLNVSPFKNDLFKVRINSSVELNSGDGIKIIDKKTKNQVASLGIGNLTKINNHTFEFVTKYKFSSGLSVFLTQNSQVENNFLNLKRTLPINFKITAISNQKMKVLCNFNGVKSYFETDFLLEEAKNAPLSNDDFYSQFNKLGETPFVIDKFSVETNGVFLPKSILNNIRRTIIQDLKEKIIFSNDNINAYFNKENYEKILLISPVSNPENIAIIDENFDVKNAKNLLKDFNTVVFSPKNYNETIILKFYDELKEKFALNLPTILNHNDSKILNSILNKLPKNISLYSNNIYGLYYNKDYKIITSPLMNIKNKFAILFLNSHNVKTICSSIESDNEFISQNNLIGFSSGNFPLMTFSHCPFKTIYENDCNSCSFKKDLELKNPNLGTYEISRTRIFNCYFELNKSFLIKNLKFYIINFSK